MEDKKHKQDSAVALMHQQRKLLQLEWDAERDEFKRQTQVMGIGRKVKRGDCWWPMTVGRSYYNSLNQLVVELLRAEADEEIEHNFEYGRTVMFFSVDASNGINYVEHGGTVSYAEQNRMVVVVDSEAQVGQLRAMERAGVQLSFDQTTYKLMTEALERAIVARPDSVLGHLRELCYGHGKPQEFTFGDITFPWLNKAQQQAVNKVLRAQDVAVVHGPPGTGKTTTLVEAIYETLRRENQVLVCAQSNMAVDWISEKLVDRGVAVLRIGNPTRVNDKMLSFTYERQFEDHPDYSELWAVRKAIRELKENRAKVNDFHQKISRLNDRAADLEMRINESIFGEARVIACTLVGSASKVLLGMKFSTLFIDEAAQALEAACWIPLLRCNRVVFAGDHQQLPPTIKCFEAARGGLSQTLMERVVRQQPGVVTLLKVQYRMNKTIMRFSSDWFYDGQLLAAPNVTSRGILDYDLPMQWIDTSLLREEMEALNADSQDENSEAEPLTFAEEYVDETHGRINKAEAELALAVLELYIEKIGKRHFLDERIDVGLISPYKAQTYYMRSLLKRRPFFKPFRRFISVNTVDGFQGQERDVMMISLVRSNDNGQIGFLNDLRRMNVAITRARMKLIIIGDSTTMTRHPFYRKLYEYIRGLE